MTIIQAQPLKQFGISGPASALDNEVPIFDGITGKKIKAATGIICPSSGRLKMSSTAPYLTLHNTAHEDTDHGRESELIFKGEQSGGEETTLGKIQVAHDGTSDDQKGIMSFKVNDGTDGDVPTTAMTILANGNVGIGTDSPSAPLHIHGSVASPNNLFLVNNTASDNYVSCFNLQTPNLTSGQSTNFYMGKGATNKNRVTLRFGYVGAGSNSNYFSLGFYGAGNLFNVMADGKVGIGTTDPSAKLDINSDIIRLRTAKTPASAGAAGNQGDECWDANYCYRCVATNTWKRTALTTW